MLEEVEVVQDQALEEVEWVAPVLKEVKAEVVQDLDLEDLVAQEVKTHSNKEDRVDPAVQEVQVGQAAKAWVEEVQAQVDIQEWEEADQVQVDPEAQEDHRETELQMAQVHYSEIQIHLVENDESALLKSFPWVIYPYRHQIICN